VNATLSEYTTFAESHFAFAERQAADKGNLEAVKILLRRGARPDCQAKDGRSALHHAAQAAQVLVVQELINAGANVLLRCQRGTTPLLNAVLSGSIETVNTLLQAGADVHERMTRRHQMDALEVAMNEGHVAIYSMLKDVCRMQSMANEGDVAGLQRAVTCSPGGHLTLQELSYRVPPIQWVPLLENNFAARVSLELWVDRSQADSTACYTALYLPVVVPQQDSRDMTERDQMSQPLRHLHQVTHDGLLHIRKLVVSFLVFPGQAVRKQLRELWIFLQNH
jgi:hypothetical protein